MLTKSDVNQIREVVRFEVEAAVETIVEDKLKPIKKDLGSLSGDLKNVKGDLGSLSQDLKYVKDDLGSLSGDLKNVKDDLKHVKKGMKYVQKDLKYIKKTVDIIGKNYDEEDIKLGKRVKRIEDHLVLPD